MTSSWELLILLFHGYTVGEKHIYYGEAVWIKIWGSRLLQMVVQSTHVNLKDIRDVKMKMKWVMPRISTYKLFICKESLKKAISHTIVNSASNDGVPPFLFCLVRFVIEVWRYMPDCKGWYSPNFNLEPIESISHMMTEDAKCRHLFSRSNIPWFRSFASDTAICLDSYRVINEPDEECSQCH